MEQNARFPQSPQFLPFSLCECDPPRPISPSPLFPSLPFSHFAHCPRNQSFRMCLSPSDADAERREREEEREGLKRRRRHTQQQAKHAAAAPTHIYAQSRLNTPPRHPARVILKAFGLVGAFWAVIGVKPVQCRRQVPPNRAENCAAE